MVYNKLAHKIPIAHLGGPVKRKSKMKGKEQSIRSKNKDIGATWQALLNGVRDTEAPEW